MIRLLGAVVSLFAFPLAAATISGTVTPSSAFATVAAYDTSGALKGTANTDASGRYTLTLPAGSYHVLAYDPAGVYATSFYADAESFETSATLTLTSSQSLTSINFVLVRGGTIVGTVTSSSGSPLNAITVEVYNPDGTRRGFTSTDSSGKYQLVVPPGTFKLAAYDHAGTYATLFFDKTASYGAAWLVSVAEGQTAGANFKLPLPVAVSGTVSQPNMAVMIYDLQNFVVTTAHSDATGHFRVALPPGGYRVVFEDPAGVYASVYYENAESFDRGTVVSGGALDPVTMVAGGRIEGTVTPAPGMTVAAYNPDGTVRAFTANDGSGHYSLLLPPGDYFVGAFDPTLVFAPQFAPQVTAFANAAAQHVSAGATVSGVDLTLPRAGRISGSVHADSGVPLAAMTVAAYDGAGNRVTTATTNANGEWLLAIAPGTYTMAAFDPQLRYVSGFGAAPITVAAGESVSGENLVETPGAGITGSVADITTNAPIAGAVVAAYDATGAAVASTTADANGSFGFAVPSGTFRIAAFDPQRRYATSFYANASSFASAMPVTFVAGQPTMTVAFRLTLAPLPPMRRRAARH